MCLCPGSLLCSGNFGLGLLITAFYYSLGHMIRKLLIQIPCGQYETNSPAWESLNEFIHADARRKQLRLLSFLLFVSTAAKIWFAKIELFGCSSQAWSSPGIDRRSSLDLSGLFLISMSCHLMFNNFHISAGLSQKLSHQQNTKVVPLLLIYLRITFLFSQLTNVWLT